MIEPYDTDTEVVAAVVAGEVHAAAAFATKRISPPGGDLRPIMSKTRPSDGLCWLGEDVRRD